MGVVYFNFQKMANMKEILFTKKLEQINKEINKLNKNKLNTTVHIVNQNLVMVFSKDFGGGFMTLFDIKFFSMIQNKVDYRYVGRIMSIIFTGAVLFMPVGSIFWGKLLNLNNILDLLYYIGFFIIIFSIFFKFIYFKNEI